MRKLARGGNYFGDITVTVEGLDKFVGAVDRASRPDTGITASTARGYATKTLRALWEATPIYYMKMPGDELPPGHHYEQLKDGWCGNTTQYPEQWAKANMQVRRIGDGYSIELKNECYYAAYVEYGHHQHIGQYASGIHTSLTQPSAPPHPFVRPTLEMLALSVQADAGTILSAQISSIFG